MQDCILIFDEEYKKGHAYITVSFAVRIDSHKFGEFYTASEQLREECEDRYNQMRAFLIKHYYTREMT